MPTAMLVGPDPSPLTSFHMAARYQPRPEPCFWIIMQNLFEVFLSEQSI